MDKPQKLLWYGQGRVGVVTDLGKIVIEPDLHRTIWPCARKQHKCCECQRYIAKGQRYELIEGLWDGDCWDRFKTCAECAAMRNDAVCHYREGIPFGELHEYLAQEVEDVFLGRG